jgi:hypothetical protein
MKLSMSTLARELPFSTLEAGSEEARYSRCEVLCTGGPLEADVLYLTSRGHIPAGATAPNGGGVVCAGGGALPGAEVLTVDEPVEIIALWNAVNAVFAKYEAQERAAAAAEARAAEGAFSALLRAAAAGEDVDLVPELEKRGWGAHDSYAVLCAPAGTSPWGEGCAFTAGEQSCCLVNLTPCGGRLETCLARQSGQAQTFGVSEVFSDLAELPWCVRQSALALERGGGRFADRALDYMLSRLPGELDIAHLISPALRILMAHDRENGSDYVRTLGHYIGCGMNAQRAAREMYIHRTTMAYRLGRIRELTGLDLDNAREMLYVHLSMLLLGGGK